MHCPLQVTKIKEFDCNFPIFFYYTCLHRNVHLQHWVWPVMVAISRHCGTANPAKVAMTMCISVYVRTEWRTSGKDNWMAELLPSQLTPRQMQCCRCHPAWLTPANFSLYCTYGFKSWAQFLLLVPTGTAAQLQHRGAGCNSVMWQKCTGSQSGTDVICKTNSDLFGNYPPNSTYSERNQLFLDFFFDINISINFFLKKIANMKKKENIFKSLWLFKYCCHDIA